MFEGGWQVKGVGGGGLLWLIWSLRRGVLGAGSRKPKDLQRLPRGVRAGGLPLEETLRFM